MAESTLFPKAFRRSIDPEQTVDCKARSSVSFFRYPDHLASIRRMLALLTDCLTLFLSSLRTAARRESLSSAKPAHRPVSARLPVDSALPMSPLDNLPERESATARSTARKILVVDADYPRPDRDSGSVRMFNMLLLMRDMGCRVQFLATKATSHDAYAARLQSYGIELAVTTTRFQMLRWWYWHGSKFDVVMLSRLPVALGNIRHVRRYAKQASVVFDTVDLHFLRISRQAALYADSEKAAWADELREYELGLMRSVDLTVVVSAYEQKLLHAIQPTVPVKVLSNIHAPHGRQLPFCARSDLLYLGNFEHEPNLDAGRWLVNELMPVLREQFKGICLHIVGHASDEVLGHLASVDVIVHGYVADLAPIFGSVKLTVAPLRYGAGVKGKINLAMSYGVPVVTTRIGAEGMNLQNGRDAMIAEGAESFASSIVEVYTDEQLWLRLSDAGIENVRRYFSPEIAADMLKEILGCSTKELNKSKNIGLRKPSIFHDG